MVLHPLLETELPLAPGVVSAWTAVERRQKAPASHWLLITQPDHADISGQIAAHIDAPGFLTPPHDVVNAIRMHDAGWSLLEDPAQFSPGMHPGGHPISFFEVAPEQFLQAWHTSVENAARDSAVGGYIVSKHFSTLGEYRLGRAEDPPEIQSELRDFIASERVRQDALSRTTHHSDQWNAYLVLLQFCDILSLYLCSGAGEAVEFPQTFKAGTVRAQRHGSTVSLSPSPLRQTLDLEVRAWEWPCAATVSRQFTISLH